MAKPLSNCPVCTGALVTTELSCFDCNTKIQSQFESCSFCSLTPEQIQFVQMFLRNRGNISAVGDELDMSYPTVARRLEAIVAVLDRSAVPVQLPMGRPGIINNNSPDIFSPVVPLAPVENPQKDASRREILEMLDRGDITAEEATQRLRDL